MGVRSLLPAGVRGSTARRFRSRPVCVSCVADRCALAGPRVSFHRADLFDPSQKHGIYHHGYSPSKMSLLTPDRTTRSPTSRCLTFERLLWLCRPCRRRLQFIVLLERLRRVDAQSHPGLLLQLESELV